MINTVLILKFCNLFFLIFTENSSNKDCILLKNSTPAVRSVPVKPLDSYSLDLNNVECIGFQEEKILMF